MLYQTVVLVMLGWLGAGGTGCSAPTGSESNPILQVSPTELDFGQDRSSLSLTIRNTGSGVLHWIIQVPSEGWVKLSQREGNTTTEPATIDVRIDRDKAPAGQQQILLLVISEGGQQAVTLKAGIHRPAKLSLLNSQLDFGETARTQQLTLRNEGGDTLRWTAISGQPWISFSPASGVLSPGAQQVVTVTVDRTGQTVGTLQGSVNFTSDGGPADASVRVDVPPRPILSASPSELDFGLSQTRLSVEVRNIGGGSTDWTLETSDAWIKPATTTGALAGGESGRVFIDVSREGLEVASYEGHLLFRWGTSTLDVKVLMRVQAKPHLSLSSDTIDLDTDSTGTFSISNTGTGTMTWKITEVADWLELEVYDGTTMNLATPVKIRINRVGLLAGPYETKVTVQSDGGDQPLAVKMSVPLPGVQLTSGPREGEEIDTDPIDFRFVGVNAFGKAEFSTRLNEGTWSNWSTANEVSFLNLEESSLAGPYVFQVRVRADAGQSEVPVERRFTVNTIKGPALRFSPKADTVSIGDEVKIELVAEEVGDILGAHAVLSFNPSLLKLQEPVEVLAEDNFLSGFGGTIVQPEPQIDNNLGRLDLAFGIAEGRQLGTPRTGAIARLHFQALKSGVVELSFRPESTLRDLYNQGIEIGLHKVKIVVK